MSCADHIRQLLKPLQVYDLEGKINGTSLDVKGEALDAVQAVLTELERELDLTTAEDWGLEQWKGLFAMLPAAPDAEQMRKSIWALQRIGPAGFTVQAIRDTLEGCGLQVEVTEVGAGKVRLRFPKVAGEPEDYEKLRANIEAILPAHVEAEYVLNYLTWESMESLRWTFRILNSLTWDRVEKAVDL